MTILAIIKVSLSPNLLFMTIIHLYFNQNFKNKQYFDHLMLNILRRTYQIINSFRNLAIVLFINFISLVFHQEDFNKIIFLIHL